MFNIHTVQQKGFIMTQKKYRCTRYRFLELISILFCMVSMAACHRDNLSVNEAKTVQIEKKMVVSERYGKSLRAEIGDIGILVMRGTDEEMGEAQGALAGKEILRLVDDFLIPAINRGKQNVWDTVMLPMAKSFALPEPYEKELASIVRGLVIRYPKDKDRMLNSIGREISLDDLRVLNCLNEFMGVSHNGCSSFSAWGPLTADGSVISGRNLDYKKFSGQIPFMVLAREPVNQQRQATIEIGGPGYVGATTAMNASGLFAMMHYVDGSPVRRANQDIPRAMVVREALEEMPSPFSIEKVADIFRNRAVQIGNNTHFSLPLQEPDSGPFPFVVEWDGNDQNDGGATLRCPDFAAVPDALICTNHFVSRRFDEKAGPVEKDSVSRYDLLARQLKQMQRDGTKIDHNAAIGLMRSVAQSGSMMTYLTVVSFPKTRQILFAVSPKPGKPATDGKWVEIKWKDVFGIE